ncbi:M20/M25/M40 family metallo-hydrolase [Ilyomonas limi]|uniref:Carboxypeptidase Q n=1 Tax=Ilyomonas limi TaxID=2575867 RepID=A0A4U3KQ47_9BACT|nr:M20/M25/M40 family metallo-hydrolase [Ilyomonas limi]TKK64251.1 M20/M25/M40 family metallo-hydrolase [Ilyomonas limi]
MKKILFLSLFLPAIIHAQSDDSVFIHQLSNYILSSDSPYNDLFYLTKRIGGRLAGSPQMVQAEAWGAKTLQQAGADAVFAQACQVPHWVRGGKDKAAVSFVTNGGQKQSKAIAVLALGNSVGTGPQGIIAPVLRVKSFDDLESKKDSVKGKIVFYDVPFDDTLVFTFRAYGKNVIYRGQGASRAAKYGALAVLVRSMSNSVDNYPHTGSMHYTDSLPKIPAAAVGLRDVKYIDSLFDAGKAVSASLFTYGKMLPDTTGHNIIGELKGQDNGIITIGGHLDSWDVNEGATDDGAGIVQTITILRAFKALNYQPKHTIRFVLFANEENGTRGAKKYAEAAKEANEKHLFALESDAGGFTPRGFSLMAADSVIDKLNSWLPLFKLYGVTDFVNEGAGADVTPLYTLLNTPVAELRPDSQRYFDVHHAPNDVLENVNIRELKLGAINMAALIYLIDKYGL